MNGAVRVDASDRAYAVAKDGSVHRVQVTGDGIYAAKKWSKARKKAARLARRRR